MPASQWCSGRGRVLGGRPSSGLLSLQLPALPEASSPGCRGTGRARPRRGSRTQNECWVNRCLSRCSADHTASSGRLPGKQ